MLAAVLLAVALIVADLVRVVDQDDDGGHEGVALGSWERKFQAARALLAKSVPLTSFKTVVVVWQILTQVQCV